MEVKDIQGKYYMKADVAKQLVIEKNFESWTDADLERFKKAYESRILPDLRRMKDGKWCKFCDLSKYIVSADANKIAEFMQWCANQGCTHVAIMMAPGSSLPGVLKLQMNRVCKPVTIKHFDNEAESYKWLREAGYKNV